MFNFAIYLIYFPEIHISLMELDNEEQEIGKKSGRDAKWPSGFITQYTQLTVRTFRNSKSLIYSKLKVIETVILCVLISLIWFQLPRTEETLRDRMGVVGSVGGGGGVR